VNRLATALLLLTLWSFASAERLYRPPEGGFAELPGVVEPSLADVITNRAGSVSFFADGFSPVFFLYKNWLTTQDGPRCRYTPTCGEYGYRAIATHGPVKGAMLAFGRMLRCHSRIPDGYYPIVYYDYRWAARLNGLEEYSDCGVWEPVNRYLYYRERKGHLVDPLPGE